MNNKRQIGFMQNQTESNPYEQFLGKPGHYGYGQIGSTGVLKAIKKEGIVVQPSIIYIGDRARIETESPTFIQNTPGQPFFAKPLREGDLEKIANQVNSKNSTSQEKPQIIL